MTCYHSTCAIYDYVGREWFFNPYLWHVSSYQPIYGYKVTFEPSDIFLKERLMLATLVYFSTAMK